MNSAIITSNSLTKLGAAADVETFAMENCKMLLSTKAAASAVKATAAAAVVDGVGRSYACKTCGRKFDSFQALGGHRASHNKLKLPVAGDGGGGDGGESSAAVVRGKSHACSICGVKFPIGQALGGHMRRHRAVVAAVSGGGSTVTTEHSDGNSKVKEEEAENLKKHKNDGVLEEEVERMQKKMLSSEQVGLDLNLSIMPWIKEEEKDKSSDKEDNNDNEIEEGEIVEQEEEEYDFLKLELRQPINNN